MTCVIVSGVRSVTRLGRYREMVDAETSVRGVVCFPKRTGAALGEAQLLMEKGREVLLVVPQPLLQACDDHPVILPDDFSPYHGWVLMPSSFLMSSAAGPT